MKFNNKGYSILEILAVIVITSAIILPLITTLVNNIEINDREQNRRAAALIYEGTLDGLGRIDFTDISNLVIAANIDNEYYIELNYDNCIILLDTEDEALCQKLFSTIWNNVSFDSTNFRVFIYNYNLPSNYQNALIVNGDIPTEVRDIIGTVETSELPNINLYRIVIWIRYDEANQRVLAEKGVLGSE